MVSVKQYGAAGDGVTNDTTAFTNALTQAALIGTAVYIPAGDYVITSDLNVNVPMYGDSKFLSQINSTRRLILDASNGLELRDFSFTSSMSAGVGGNSAIYATITGQNLTLANLGLTYLPGTAIADINKQMINLNNVSNVSINGCDFTGGTATWLQNCSSVKITNNFIDCQNLGSDAMKLTLISDKVIITGNHVYNAFNDGLDTYTSGAYVNISDNVFDTIAFNGIQTKTVYRFAPYTAGSSDQPLDGFDENIIISNNIFNNITMSQATGGSDAAAIYCLFLDERFHTISNATNNGGAIQITTADAHGYSSGNIVKILGVLGTTEANGIWTINVIDTTNFTLNSSTFTRTWIASQGYVTYARAVTGAASNGGLIQLTVPNHGLTTGNIVIVQNVGGTTEANSTWAATVINSNTITLQGSTFTHAYTSGGSCSLSLTARNAPSQYTISNNIITEVNTGLVSGPTCGIYMSGVNATISNNVVMNCYKGASAASYAGSGILIGTMRSSLTPTFPQNIVLSGNIAMGENCGIAINATTIDKLSLIGNNAGFNAKTNTKSAVAGFFVGTASIINRLTCNGNILDSSSKSYLNSSAGSSLTNVIMSGNTFSNTLEAAVMMASSIFANNFINGIATFGSTTSSLASSNMIYEGNMTTNGGSSSSAVAFDGFTGLTFKDNNIIGGREMMAVRTHSQYFVVKDNIGSGQLDYVITNAADNGAGLIRITTSVSNSRATSDVVTISAVGGVSAANGTWTITVIDATNFDLQGSTFAGSYTSGGVMNGVLHYVTMTSGEIATGTISGNYSF